MGVFTKNGKPWLLLPNVIKIAGFLQMFPPTHSLMPVDGISKDFLWKKGESWQGFA